MTKNNLMNASRRTALKFAGASAALVAGGVSAAEAATRSGGKRARVTPVTQRPGGQRGGQRGQHGGGQHGGAASSALVQVFAESAGAYCCFPESADSPEHY